MCHLARPQCPRSPTGHSLFMSRLEPGSSPLQRPVNKQRVTDDSQRVTDEPHGRAVPAGPSGSLGRSHPPDRQTSTDCPCRTRRSRTPTQVGNWSVILDEQGTCASHDDRTHVARRGRCRTIRPVDAPSQHGRPPLTIVQGRRYRRELAVLEPRMAIPRCRSRHRVRRRRSPPDGHVSGE
jgi:hypothetical protein